MLKVDCHTHWGRAWHERDGDDPGQWLAVAESYGVTHAIVLPHHGLENAGKIVAEHDHLAAVCARSDGHMLPFCTACVWEPQEGPEEIERCLGTLKFRGIKFHPWLQGCSVSSPVMDEIAEIAAEHDVPILFHDGTPPFSLPSQIALLAQRHPRTRIVLGHSGLFEHVNEAIAAMQTTPNLWACICGPTLAGMRLLVDRCPSERLLWGTDAGYTLSDVHAYRWGIFAQLGLSGALYAAICSDNPRRLLHL